MMYSLLKWTICMGTVLLTVSSPGHTDGSILIRHDRSDSVYIALGSEYADVLAHVNERAEGTVLAPLWILTSAHVLAGPFDDSPYVVIRGERYAVEKAIIHPEWEMGWEDLLSNHDLALLKLQRRVPDVRPVVLYRDTNELGQVLTLLGRGKTGTGLTGQIGEKGSVVRGATNRVTGASETALLFVFQDPTKEDVTELEGVGGSGDSGGPALLERRDTLYLVGVGSASTQAQGYSAYGSLDVYTRVSSFADWIEDTMAADPDATWSRARPLGGTIDAKPGRSAAQRWPAAPVGAVAEQFFSAYEEALGGKFAALERFLQTLGPAGVRVKSVKRVLVDELGTLDLRAYSLSGSNHIRVLVHSLSNDSWHSIGIEVSPDEPRRVTHLYMKAESPWDGDSSG